MYVPAINQISAITNTSSNSIISGRVENDTVIENADMVKTLYPWQANKKRKIFYVPKHISNKFVLLASESTTNASDDAENISKPPSIFMYGITNYKKRLVNLSQAVPEKHIIATFYTLKQSKYMPTAHKLVVS